jgi:hypothetical protein
MIAAGSRGWGLHPKSEIHDRSTGNGRKLTVERTAQL